MMGCLWPTAGPHHTPSIVLSKLIKQLGKAQTKHMHVQVRASWLPLCVASRGMEPFPQRTALHHHPSHTSSSASLTSLSQLNTTERLNSTDETVSFGGVSELGFAKKRESCVVLMMSPTPARSSPKQLFDLTLSSSKLDACCYHLAAYVDAYLIEATMVPIVEAHMVRADAALL